MQVRVPTPRLGSLISIEVEAVSSIDAECGALQERLPGCPHSYLPVSSRLGLSVLSFVPLLTALGSCTTYQLVFTRRAYFHTVLGNVEEMKLIRGAVYGVTVIQLQVSMHCPKVPSPKLYLLRHIRGARIAYMSFRTRRWGKQGVHPTLRKKGNRNRNSGVSTRGRK